MINLQFVQGTDAGAHLIEWFGGGPAFSHVDIVLPDGQLLGARSDEVGGRPAGVQARDSTYVGENKTIRVSIAGSTPQHEALALEFAKSQIGAPYDSEAIAAFVVGRDWREPNTWFCSELAARVLELAGCVKTLAAPANKVTPAALLLVVSALTDVVIPE